MAVNEDDLACKPVEQTPALSKARKLDDKARKKSPLTASATTCPFRLSWKKNKLVLQNGKGSVSITGSAIPLLSLACVSGDPFEAGYFCFRNGDQLATDPF
jgi:hypothetical protein